MAGHAYLNQVKDPGTQAALKDLMGQIVALTTRVAQLEAGALMNTSSLNANGQRVINVGQPSADTDAVNLGTMRAFVAAQQGAFP